MSVDRSIALISGRLRFNGRLAAAATAISFFVMILSLSVSAGFRTEIRKGISEMTGDVQMSPVSASWYGESNPICSEPSYLDKIEGLKGVESITPAVYRAGIVRSGTDIQGILIKGVPTTDTLSLQVRVPSRLAKTLNLAAGDQMLTYFVGQKVKMRKFTIAEIYDCPVETEDNMLIYASIDDLRRLNGWADDEASALEVKLDASLRDSRSMKEMAAEIGAVSMMNAAEDEAILVSTAACDKYSQLFDWLDLIDFNVLAILLLMTAVAGFNMISGLLILLFRNIPTIGTLKALGSSNRSISKVFLRVSSRLVLIGMAIGNGLALLFCLIQGTTHLIKLNPENYFLPFVPVSVDPATLIIVNVMAYAAIMILLLIPCRFISKVDPAETMKVQ